jgi:integrase
VSWPSRESLETDLQAFFQMREIGLSLPELVSRVRGGQDPASFMNLGPQGPIEFEKYCQKIFMPQRQKLGGWPREEQRLEWIFKQGKFKGRELHTIRPKEVQEWYDGYSNRPEITSDNARANQLKVVRAIFKTATKLGYLIEDPASEVCLPAVPESSSRAPTYNETVRLYLAADPIVRPWFLLTLHAGLRPVEIVRLRVAHVNLEERRLTVIGRTVKNRSRDIFVHDDLVPVFKVLASAVPNLPLLRDEKDRPVPFPRHAWNRTVERAKVQDLTFYMLRHGFATRLLETGTRDPETRAYLMGKRLRSTLSIYTHISFAQVREAIRRLPSVVHPASAPALKVDNKVDNEAVS